MVAEELPPEERVQRELEEQEFARGHVPPGSPPVEPSAAATVCLARSRTSGFELLLLQRPMTSRFAAGAYVFPGGRIDPEDRTPAALARLAGGATSEPAALFAALREAFEETGFLLPFGEPDNESLVAVREGRVRVLDGKVRFADLLAEHGLMLDATETLYFGRWITPVQLSRRYDTRFFLARHPGGEPELTQEHTAFVWLEPAAALERFAAGRLPMLFPTRKTIEQLRRFNGLAEVFEAFRGREVTPILAELIIEAGRVRPAPVDL